MNRKPAAWIALLALAVSACAQSPAPEPFPQATADAFAASIAARDAAATAAFYTEDAVLLPPDQEPVTGRAAIQEFFARTNGSGSADIMLATVETSIAGEQAWRQGSFRVGGTATDAPFAGKFIEVWKKVDGAWLIHRDIWNANAPRPAAPVDAAGDEPA